MREQSSIFAIWSALLCELQSLSNGYLHSAGMPSLYLIYSIVKNLGHLHAWAVKITAEINTSFLCQLHINSVLPGDEVLAAQCYLCTCQGACAQDPVLRGPGDANMCTVTLDTACKGSNVELYATATDLDLSSLIVTRIKC